MAKKLDFIKNITEIVVLAVCLISLAGCGSNKNQKTYADTESKLLVFVSVLPQVFIVEKIGGERVSVSSLVDKGQEPHDFQPTPKQIMALGKANLYFTINLPFEKNISSKLLSACPSLDIVTSSRGIKYRTLKHSHVEKEKDRELKKKCNSHVEHESDNHKNDECENYEDGNDPHVWLGIKEMKIMASNVFKTLKEKRPQYAECFQTNYDSFLVEIDSVHREVSNLLLPFKGRKVFVFHPAFGYFTDTYGLIQEAVEIDGKSPSPKQLSTLITDAKKENVKIVFVQPQFDTRSASTIARAIGGVVVPLDPIAENVLRNYGIIAREIESALKNKTL